VSADADGKVKVRGPSGAGAEPAGTSVLPEGGARRAGSLIRAAEHPGDDDRHDHRAPEPQPQRRSSGLRPPAHPASIGRPSPHRVRGARGPGPPASLAALGTAPVPLVPRLRSGGTRRTRLDPTLDRPSNLARSSRRRAGQLAGRPPLARLAGVSCSRLACSSDSARRAPTTPAAAPTANQNARLGITSSPPPPAWRVGHWSCRAVRPTVAPSRAASRWGDAPPRSHAGTVGNSAGPPPRRAGTADRPSPTDRRAG
jgi:hypothetical protein